MTILHVPQRMREALGRHRPSAEAMRLALAAVGLWAGVACALALDDPWRTACAGPCFLLACYLVLQLAGADAAAHRAGGEMFARLVPQAATDAPARAPRAVQACRKLADEVQELVAESARSSRAVMSDAAGIAHHCDALARGAEEIASMLEESAAGMEEFAASIERNAASCRDASDRGQEAKAAADAAVQGIGELLGSLRDAAAYTSRVSALAAGIEDIASQTRGLALSASVESARAGSSFQGFAQFAADVRDLAQRSAEAAHRVKDLMGQAVADGADLSRLAASARSAITEAAAHVTSTSPLISEIALASSEQNAGVGQIKMAIEQMATLTQENALAVDEASRIAHALSRESSQLARHFETADQAFAPLAGTDAKGPGAARAG